jgi:endonuclease/exonuclease/phosphatase family metal-dependent hydrolase
VGNGDIPAFVRDLRAGLVTNGRPVRHFVLMLQEAVRTAGVPPLSVEAVGAQRIAARAHVGPVLSDGPEWIDIVDISRDLSTHLLYVPSMRNGNSPDEAAADRGSAILSTLPLSDPVAVELPGERQRRVAIVAKLSVPSSSASQVSVGVVHLDALGAPSRFWLFGTSWMRELQVKSMGSLLPPGNLVLGADLNTWHGTSEPAVRHLTQLFAGTPMSLNRDGLGLRVLDYMFFRAEPNRSAHYEVVTNAYGSDHRPLVGWIQ